MKKLCTCGHFEPAEMVDGVFCKNCGMPPPKSFDPTRNERQARLRDARRKWLKAHGFKSPEGLVGALMRGEYIIIMGPPKAKP